MAQRKAAPLVGLVMGSDSDWEVMRHAATLSVPARQVFRRLLIVSQERGLDADIIARAAAQASAHFEF